MTHNLSPISKGLMKDNLHLNISCEIIYLQLISDRILIFVFQWSEVYSADLFHSRFEKEGLDNAKCGADYRNMILAKGATKVCLVQRSFFT